MESKLLSKKVKAIIASVCNVKVSDIGDDCSMDTLPQWDSLKHINLISVLEEEFNISLPDSDVSSMVNYKLICLTLQEKIK
jgi:acyl carrier protein